MLRLATVLFVIFSLGSGEFVPALVWQFGSQADPIKIQPALHKVSTESFRDLVTKQSANKDLVIVFAEENLSVEDFNWQDKVDAPSFSKMSQLSNGLHSTYYSHVEDAMDGAMSIQGAQWANIKLGLDLPAAILEKKLDSKFLLVNMDDAADFEDRPNLLRRHDEIVSRTLEAAKSSYDRVLAIYTGYHTSWTPEEAAIRRIRAVSQPDEPNNGSRFINVDGKAFLYYSSAPTLKLGETIISLDDFLAASFTEEEESPDTLEVVYYYSKDAQNISIIFPFAERHSGYWNLDTIQVMKESDEYVLGSSEIYAPYRFSYHCRLDTVFSNKSGNSLTFTDFQIEPLPPRGEEQRFSDAYDCISFFTMPIWSGILVTILLLMILSCGLGMIVDIKVMDRFDDPKGKTISISNTD